MQNRLILTVLMCVPVWAQDPVSLPLSLKDAVQLALTRNKSLEAAGAAKDIAEHRITQAKSGFLPKVNYSESWTRSDNPVFVFSSLLTQHQFEIGRAHV